MVDYSPRWYVYKRIDGVIVHNFHEQLEVFAWTKGVEFAELGWMSFETEDEALAYREEWASDPSFIPLPQLRFTESRERARHYKHRSRS